MPDRRWSTYLAGYHAARPGITEAALDHARDPEAAATAHDWLADGIPGPHGDVLDVACGSAPMHPRLDFASYLGIDLSEPELDLARARGRGPVVLADACALPLPGASVDTVVCSLALMLADPVHDAVAEMVRVLRPGGRLALLLPATWPVRRRDLAPIAVLTLTLGGPGSMPQSWGPRRMSRLLRGAGLHVDSVSRRRFPFPLRGIDDARLAVESLYTPGRDVAQLQRAVRRLTARATPTTEVGLPLMRVIAHRPVA